MLGTYETHKITLVLVQTLIDFLLIYLLLIDPLNKATLMHRKTPKFSRGSDPRPKLQCYPLRAGALAPDSLIRLDLHAANFMPLLWHHLYL